MKVDASALYGWVELSPDEPVRAGSIGTWTLVYHVGSLGIDEGGTIKLPWSLVSDWGPPQADHPAAENFVSVATTGNARLSAAFKSKAYFRPRDNALVIDVHDGPLAPNDTVTITYGDTRYGSPGMRAQTFCEQRLVFAVAVDPHRSNRFSEVPDPPSLSIVHGPAAALVAIAPTQVDPDANFSVRVKAEDAFGNPCYGYHADVALICSDGSKMLFARDPHAGHLRVDGVRLDETGLHALRVEASDGLWTETNPILSRASGFRRYWGDLHAQSEETIGAGTIDDFFTYARDWAMIDFVGHQGIDWELPTAFWGRLQERTRHYHQPGVFVPFLGYEWAGTSPLGGDHNVYFIDDEAPILRSSHERLQGPTSNGDRFSPISELYLGLADLNREAGRRRAMVVPHVGGRRCNLAWHDPTLEPAIEIQSWWGEFEWLLKEALARGMIVGVVAGSDDHVCRPGDAAPGGAHSPVHGGLTCVQATELTREAIWEALWSRRCYATNGPRIFLNVALGAHSLGERVLIGHPFEVAVEVGGTAPIERIDLFRGDELIKTHPSPMPRSENEIRIAWSGALTRERERNAHWDGSVEIEHGSFIESHGYAFDFALEGITSASPSYVEWRSTTAGDVDGVILEVDGNDETRFRFRSPLLSDEFRLAAIRQEPIIRELGGVDLQVVAEMLPRGFDDRYVQTSFADNELPASETPYWVRVLQADGGKAWSSPIWVAAQPGGNLESSSY